MQVRFREGRVVASDIGTHIISSMHIAEPGVGSANITDFAVTRNKIAYDSIGTISNIKGSFTVPSGSDLGGIAYNPEKHNIWYISKSNDYIFNIGTTTHNLLGSFKTPVTSPLGLTFASDNHRLWNVDDNEYIYMLGTTTGNKIGSFRTPDPVPYGLEYDSDHHRLWYTSTNVPWNYIFQLGTRTGPGIGSTGNIIGSFKGPLSTGIRGLAYISATHRLWVAYKSPNTIFEIGTTNGNVVGSIPANLPGDLAFATDKNRLWDTASNITPALKEIYEIGTVIEYSPLRSRSVEHWNISDGAIGSTQVANNTIGYEKLTTGLQGSLGGVSGPNTIGTTQLKEPSVGSSQLYSPAVGSQNIYNQAVYAAKIKRNTIGSQQLANGAVIGTKIVNNAVGYGKLTTGLQGTYMPVTGGTFIGSVDYSGAGKPPRLAILTPGGAIPPVTLGATGTVVHDNFSFYEQRFNPGTSNYLYWEFQIPKYYDGGTLNMNVFWKGYPATGTVVWKAATLGRTTSETWNNATSALGSKCTNTQGSAKVTKSTITGKPDWAADELAVVKLWRDGANAEDTLAGSVSLLMVSIDYKAVK